MANRGISEEIINLKLNAARKEFEKIAEKYEKCKQAVEKYERVKEVFNELGKSDGGEAEKLEWAKKALRIYGGMASYKQIHRFLNENGINSNLSEQATYSFLTRRSSPENGIVFLREGLFRLLEKKPEVKVVNLEDPKIEDLPF